MRKIIAWITFILSIPISLVWWALLNAASEQAVAEIGASQETDIAFWIMLSPGLLLPLFCLIWVIQSTRKRG